MEVALWQLGILQAILLASYLFGKAGWIGSIGIAAVWTIVMIFTSWLMILQFITIAAGGLLGLLLAGRVKSAEERVRLEALKESAAVFALFAIGGAIYLLFKINPERRFAFDLGTVGVGAAYAAALFGAAAIGGTFIWIVSGAVFRNWKRETLQYGGSIVGVVVAIALTVGNETLRQRGLLDGVNVQTYDQAAPSTVSSIATPNPLSGGVGADPSLAKALAEYATQYPQYDPKSAQYDPEVVRETLLRTAYYQFANSLKEADALSWAVREMSQSPSTRVSIHIIDLGNGSCRFNATGQRTFVSLQGPCPAIVSKRGSP